MSSADETALRHCLVHDSAIGLLAQFETLLQAIRLSASDALVAKSSIIPHSTIGKHLRHVLDHFTLIYKHMPTPVGKDVPAGRWTIDYDSRQREILTEQNIEAADSAIRSVKTLIRSCQMQIALTTPVVVRAQTGPDKPRSELLSTYGRELWFATNHAIHHAALVRVLCFEQHIPLPPTFGVAPSTLDYLAKHTE
ncbi:uncharacterized protein BJ171DRAFT_493873 [Polychytrium aggregatum]|uniref:uncharacterized protein n=1 Tax=Polychytrium aggregatum TaxID=110093 RepID=UPI0022FDEAD6|nr:uncharacterized protein BJ171DRAFT_493873 [Polychytrium aggregatum]KAI9207200.1 hypothetical protein BJ171DRAFT_493873 [Polychytrium aggregatum]